MRVHQALNCGRAITLCWSANIVINARLTTMASSSETSGPELIVFGTPRPVTKPIP